MIITRTPTRISFLGGGTDYPEYFLEHGGAVLATSIDKYCYVGLRNGKSWVLYDIPSRSGMGTSSAYTVGLLKACSHYDNRTIAQIATIIERDKLAGNVGFQDQYMCAVGGFKLLQFSPSGIAEKEIADVDWLNDYLLLFDTSRYRSAGTIVSSQLERVELNLPILDKLKEMVYTGEDLLNQKDYRGFGKLLDEAWTLKKSLAGNVSNEFIDSIYSKAIQMGAIGGKLLGAGGGGFIMFLAELERHEDIKKELRLFHVPFKFEKWGSQIIYADKGGE